MSDLFEDPSPGGNAPEFTVTEISGAVRRVIEGEFSRVRVRGEVGRVSRPGSGHLYFDLKDDRSVLAAVSWRAQAARLTVRPEEGMEVIAVGRLTTFGAQSKYQLVVEELQLAGQGALLAMLERRRKALAAEGLFDSARKRPLPYLPAVIGVVTSPSGAVIRDILHRLRDRFPREVLVWPVTVQGTRCADEVAAAIRGFNALAPGGALPRPDVLIVARGGGSIEDLWGFNEEVVVRAAAASDIPLISAVGHETDTTLIDLAADVRAPTPTAAAELAVPVRAELLATVAGLEERRLRALARSMEQARQRLRDLARALPRPEALTAERGQQLDHLATRHAAALPRFIDGRHRQLGAIAFRPERLEGLVATKKANLDSVAERLSTRLGRVIERGRDRLAAQRLSPARLEQRRAEATRGLLQTSERLSRATGAQLAGWRGQLDGLERVRQTVGYRATLKRGFAVVHGPGGVVASRDAAAAEAALEIEFADGRLPVAPGNPPPEAPSRPAPRRKTARGDPQGSLF